MWCLPPKHVERFKNALRSGDIDPMSLAEMSSAERRAVFEKHLGAENAEPINAQFETKLLLKNRQMGYVSWAKKMLGENTPAGRDLISRIERMEKLLSPAEEKAFLEDLTARKLGTRVTAEEAGKIAELSKAVGAAKEANPNSMEYGRAAVALRNYVSEMGRRGERFQLPNMGKYIETAAGISKSAKAALDNSAIFRQGWKTLWTNPVIWQRNARKTFVDLARQFGGKNVLDEVDAEIISRPNHDLMRRAKLDIGGLEEAYPSTLPEKIPVLGRAYKASEAAYTGFSRRTRADVFDKMIDIANKTGVELNDAELQSIGKLVNSLTGRGHLGRAEPAANIVNNVLFSPRFVKSQFDVLGGHAISGAGGSNFVRRQAALNLLKVVGGTAAVLATAKALKPDSVEVDPRSSDFGKIRVGDTRFDVSGGMASIITLASRLATMSSKSSTTGKVMPLNARTRSGEPKFGAQTGKDVLYDFIENKTSPAATVALELLKGETREGGPPTVASTVRGLVEPMPVANYIELKNNPNSANILAAMIADGLGIGTNTYSAKKKKRTR